MRRRTTRLCCIIIAAAAAARAPARAPDEAPEAVDAHRAAENAESAESAPAPQGLIKRRVPNEQAIAWPQGLADARGRAQADGKPLLARVGSASCPWCEKLLEAIETPQVQEQLKRWTLVYVDADRSPGEARQLAAGAIPALRAIDASGKVVAAHEGYLERDKLVSWLTESFDRAQLKRPEVLAAGADLEEADLDELIELLQSPDVIEREAALRRLMPHPGLAAAGVVKAFARGKLATRLSALELLGHWRAPIEGVDPWRPETITAERAGALAAWAERVDGDEPPAAAELFDDQLQLAAREMDRLTKVDDADVEAIVERLVRLGPALKPLVAESLKTAHDDRAHQRLLLLRYRLVATDALVLDWPGGLARLASGDVNVRHQAASQLVERATAADEALLLELFADPDALVREISLRGLHNVAADASSSALVKLLEDPEPNVRAAVLKQLAESPDPALSPRIAAYLKTEADPDLVVHGIRVLREAKTSGNLIELLRHESWQVRAEAAEALGGLASETPDEEATADMYVALIETLSDPDPFVVSRAVGGLRSSNLAAAIEPLVKAVANHPNLAADVIETLADGPLRDKAKAVLRRYLEHDDPRVRAQVIGALAKADADSPDELVLGGLKDPAPLVRTAAAKALLQLCNLNLPGGGSASTTSHGLFSNPFAAAADFLLGRGVRAAPRTRKSKADGDEAAGADTDGASQDDGELLAFQSGKGRAKWMQDAIEPLEKMLEAESDSEGRLAAALALVPLGRDARAMPVVREIVQSNAAALEEAAGALPWLVWAQRLKFFDELVAREPDENQLRAIAQEFLVRDGDRAVERLWQLLQGDDQKPALAMAIGQVVMSAYDNSNPTSGDGPKLDKDQLAELTKYARDGTAWQKNVALARLVDGSPEDAAQLARNVYENPQTSAPFRHDALQLLLASLEQKEAQRLAVKEIASLDPAIRKLAMLYLARGPTALNALRDRLQVHSSFAYYASLTGEPITVEPPANISEETLAPLLADSDEEVAAAAGYLLVLLGNPDGLPKLAEVWRRHKTGNNWTVPLYQAIATLDDDRHAPLLAEISRQLSDFDKRQFYWTIRSMHGPAVLKLRKKIRDEVGMDNLR